MGRRMLRRKKKHTKPNTDISHVEWNVMGPFNSLNKIWILKRANLTNISNVLFNLLKFMN